jgi:hypothetical protein
MAVILVLIIGVAATYPSSPMLLLGGLSLLAAVGVPFVFFPFSRTIWTAIDIISAPLGLDEGVAPGFELEQPDPNRRARR